MRGELSAVQCHLTRKTLYEKGEPTMADMQNMRIRLKAYDHTVIEIGRAHV